MGQNSNAKQYKQEIIDTEGVGTGGLQGIEISRTKGITEQPPDSSREKDRKITKRGGGKYVDREVGRSERSGVKRESGGGGGTVLRKP